MTPLIRDVTDLPDGTRIPAGPDIGNLTVVGTFDDYENGRLVGVEVDVTVGLAADVDVDTLHLLVGAESAAWLGNTPTRRYRLYYPPNATVTTIGDGAGS